MPAGKLTLPYPRKRFGVSNVRNALARTVLRRGMRRWKHKQIIKVVKSQLETKYYSVQNDAADNTQIYSAAVFTDVFAPAQGNADTQHIGDKVTYTSFMFKYSIAPDATNVAAAGRLLIRIMIIKWHPDTGVTGDPTRADIFNSDASETSFFMGPLKIDNRNMFTIEYDKVHQIQGATAVSDYRPQYNKIHSFGKKLNGIVNFNAAGVTGSNKLWILIAANIGTTDVPTVRWTLVTRFKDG